MPYHDDCIVLAITSWRLTRTLGNAKEPVTLVADSIRYRGVFPP
jgi:hypothetical protein